MKRILSVILALCLTLVAAAVMSVSVYAAPTAAGGSRSFTAIDDSIISSVPIPPCKVNVFVVGSPSCFNTRWTLTGISESDFLEDPAYNFFYADIEGNNKNTVKNMSKDFAAGITFCYGDNSGVMREMYSEYNGNPANSVTMPVVIYVDDKGKVRKVTEGLQEASDIADNLSEIYKSGHSDPGGDDPSAMSGITGDCTWKRVGTELTISGKGYMDYYDDEYNPAPWGTDITKVTINEGVLDVGKSAFSGCNKLTEIHLPDSLCFIYPYAFKGCSSINSFTIPKRILIIEDNAFSDCPNIERFILDKSNNYYTVIDGVLYDKEITRLVACPAKRKTLDIPDTVTSILAGAFSCCNHLTEIDFPSGITEIGSGALDDTAWYAMQPEGVVYVCRIAYKCKGNSVKDITLKNGTVEVSDNAFEDHTELRKIKFPNSLRRIGWNAFNGCYNLQSVSFPDGIEEIGYNAFMDCFGLKSVTIPGSVNEVGLQSFCNCGSLTEAVIKKGVKEIGEGAFGYCYSLSNVNLPEGLEKIGADAFIDCKSLTQITLPESVRTIGDSAFSGSFLESVTIPRNVAEIGEGAFSYCRKLGSISVDTNNRYFDSRSGCNAIIRKIDDTLLSGCMYTVIPRGVKRLGSASFCYAEGLTGITIPDSVTEIEEYAFYGCTKLKKIVVPDSVRTIGEYALGFYFNDDYWSVEEVAGFKICGSKGSAAEQYADEYDLTFVVSSAAASDTLLGDTDSDGSVTIIDATVIQRHLATLPTKIFNASAADTDMDGEVTIIDATAIQRFLAELPTLAKGIGKPI